MKLESESLEILNKALGKLSHAFLDLPGEIMIYDHERLNQILQEVAERLQDNYPYFHPLYAGQMLKPPHVIARLAYMLALWINPNNHALDGGRASSRMEKETVAEIANLFGWKNALGHLCSGGTMANLEALWISGKLHPEKAILASEQAHYTHSRISDVLKLRYKTVPCDHRSKMNVDYIEKTLSQGDVGTIVVTVGTTGTGAVDPLFQILELKRKYDFRIHADAAYGGYYTLVDNLGDDTKGEFACLSQIDSLVIDPHKHGLQPYGCGCVLFKDPSVGIFYKHESPYTYFTSSELHLGEISLECSRPGAAAVALWATQKLFPMVKGGEFAGGLSYSREAALRLYEKLNNDSRFLTLMQPELDIVVWAIRAKTAGEISNLSRKFFELAVNHNLHLAIFSHPSSACKYFWPGVEFDQPNVTCLRSCLMKPEHLDWVGRIWEIMLEVMDELS